MTTRLIFKLKSNRMDDRAYCMALLSWHLLNLRRNDGLTQAPKADFNDYFQSIKNFKEKQNPFRNQTNPFANRRLGR